MALLIISIPFMVLGVSMTVVPGILAMARQRGHDALAELDAREYTFRRASLHLDPFRHVIKSVAEEEVGGVEALERRIVVLERTLRAEAATS